MSVKYYLTCTSRHPSFYPTLGIISEHETYQCPRSRGQSTNGYRSINRSMGSLEVCQHVHSKKIRKCVTFYGPQCINYRYQYILSTYRSPGSLDPVSSRGFRFRSVENFLALRVYSCCINKCSHEIIKNT